jgi:hypothetical protein
MRREQQRLCEAYRAVFNTDLGIIVLDDMAKELGFYSNLATDEDRVLFNYFRSVLEKLGIFDYQHVKDAAVMRKLISLPMILDEKDA